MSFRTLKKLLGESSLERKCRFLLGAGILVLIVLSFWLYAWQTEKLAFEQTINTGRLLVDPLIARVHLESDQRRSAMKEFQEGWEKHWPEGLSNYHYYVLRPNATKPQNRPDNEEIDLIRAFAEDPTRLEEVRHVRDKEMVYYYAPIRAAESCLKCHPVSDAERLEIGEIRPNGILAVIRFELSTEHIRSGLHANRAYLITNGLVTALLIVGGTYLIIRYVIVKPVRHLKQVTEAVANGQYSVRSEISTGDEFEDLSYAFNRMLRNLVTMQEKLRRANSDLDFKVDQLARANMALYESNRIKSDFLATMSHELRTPLNSILGFSDVLLGNPQLSDKQQRWVANIQTSGQQLLGLINDVLDLAKIEAGKMQIRPESFRLADVCDTLLQNLRPLAEKKNIDLRQQVSADLPTLHQDAGKLRQILTNLLTNAIKFTPEGGRVAIRADADSQFVNIHVVDTGVGISPDDQHVIFEKFRQSANPLTREHEGSGLGLSIVRELTRLLGGDVSLQSELGRGSTFSVKLPVQLPATVFQDPVVRGLPGAETPMVKPESQ
jgi:signal transduction histidine kinase